MQEKSQTKSIVKQNILQFIEFKGFKKAEFYKKTCITRGILDQNNGMTEENIARFLAVFPDVDANWLITGEGSMYRTTGVMNGEQPDNRDETIRILNEQIADKNKIIALLEIQIATLEAGGKK